MCGIVGLFLKDPKLEPKLGTLLSEMLVTMSDRGPDSAGFAVYGEDAANEVKITVRRTSDFDFGAFLKKKPVVTSLRCAIHDTHAVLSVKPKYEAAARAKIDREPGLSVVGSGFAMELYKEVGLPADVSKRFGLSKMRGTHAIGHTRMATESAVTTNGAHPFSTGADECLVHNGSLSNHNDVRRFLVKQGLRFSTENDTEVAAGYMSWKMRSGASLTEAMESSIDVLDGFYTFVMGTRNGFGVLRDPIACKPAVMAETDKWVAFGTEYRALVNLPGVENAKVWEPQPAKAYIWERAQ